MMLRAAWILGYVALVAAVLTGLLVARERTLASLGGEAAQRAWDDWRSAAERQTGKSEPLAGPVLRRAPRSAEPPALVLLRDHFGVCLAGGLLFSSLLYGVLAFYTLGVLEQSPRAAPEPPPPGD